MTKSRLEQFTTDPEAMRLFQQERLIVAVTELICKAMNDQGLKRSDLAIRLGKSKGRISQYLDGEKNLTLRTIADIFNVLGLTMRVEAEPRSIQEDRDNFLLPACLGPNWQMGYLPSDYSALNSIVTDTSLAV